MLKVFKFGGASVKDAASVRNVCDIIRAKASPELVVVVSAMGKTTNALEKVVNAWHGKDEALGQNLQDVVGYHEQIIHGLFPEANSPTRFQCDLIFGELEGMLSLPPSNDFDRDYDQVVSLGEMLSSAIIAGYLQQQGMPCKLFDARLLIRTDGRWREGNVDWETTGQLLQTGLIPYLKAESQPTKIALTQGFVGGTSGTDSVTLGREGSDYSAAIFSYLLDADEMVVWKDVPGILNADPRYFENASLLQHISYREAIELTYYGASVIHPKTIKPLQNKSIPLKVKSFLHPDDAGTSIGAATADDDKTPSLILKPAQVLLSISPKDFSFIAENNLSEIFSALAQSNIRINMMQQSAISFSICFDENNLKMDVLLALLGQNFEYRYNTGLQLLTIRHFDTFTVNKVLEGRQVIMEQRSRLTAQFVIKEKMA